MPAALLRLSHRLAARGIPLRAAVPRKNLYQFT
jgi:hypothetical protein